MVASASAGCLDIQIQIKCAAPLRQQNPIRSTNSSIPLAGRRVVGSTPSLLARCVPPVVGAAQVAAEKAKQADRAEPMEAARDDFMDICRFRCGEVSCNLHKMEKALRGTYLDIRSSNESTIHQANGLLIQALQLFSDNTDLVQSAHQTCDPYSHMLHCWASKLEKDTEMMCQGEKGRKYMFLLNNIYDVLQMMRHPGASFPIGELVSRLNSLTQRCKKSYFTECWLPMTNTLHSNLDEFTAEFLATCDKQRSWKITAELRYELRQEIVDLIVPSYEVSLSARQASQSRPSGVLCSFKRVFARKKKQKKYTGEELAEEIRELFEG